MLEVICPCQTLFILFLHTKLHTNVKWYYLSSQASRLLAAPINSTTEVRKSLGGLREVLPSHAGLLLRSDMAFCRLFVADLILMTRFFKLSVSTP